MKSVFYMRCAKICGISIRNTSSMFLHLSSFLTMYVNIIGRFTKTEKLKLNRDFTENLISNKEIFENSIITYLYEKWNFASGIFNIPKWLFSYFFIFSTL